MTYVDDYVARLNAIQSARMPTNLIASLTRPTASQADFANMILRKARSDFDIQPAPSLIKEDKSFGQHSKSVGLWILDKLSRPNYAVAEAVDTLANEGGNPLKGAWEGLSGKEKTSFIDVLQAADERHIKESEEYQQLGPGTPEAEAYLQKELKKKNTSAVVYGLLGDIALDPLNLVGAGAVKGPIKAAKGLKKGAQELDEVEGAAEAVVREAADVGQSGAVLSPRQEGLIAAEQQMSEIGKQNLPSFLEKKYPDIQRANIASDSEKVLDQFAKGSPEATDLLTNKNLLPLAPASREAVERTVAKIAADIGNPAVKISNYNAQAQSAVANKLLSPARQQVLQANPVTYGVVPEKFQSAIFDRYVQLVRHAEESMIERKGDIFKPRGGLKAGSPYLRLSDVLETLPREVAQAAILGDKTKKVSPSVILRAIVGEKAALTQIAKQPELKAAIEATDWSPLMVKDHAARVIEDANAAKAVTEATAGAINTVEGAPISDVNKANFIEQITRQSKAQFAGAMPETRDAMNEMLNKLRREIPQAVNPSNLVEFTIQRGKTRLAAGVTGGKSGDRAAQAPRIETSSAHTADVLTTEFGPVSGATSVGQIVRTAATDVARASAAAEGGIISTVLSWIKPNAGYKDLRPLVLKHIGARRASATTRAHDIIRIFNAIPPKETMDFWNEVRGFIPTNPAHAQQVEQLQMMLGNLFGESGLASKFAGNTAIARSGTNVAHLNKHMRIVGIKDFKFEDKVPDPVNPSKKIMLTGPEILQGWKSYSPENPEDLRMFAFNLTQAVENAMVEYSAFAQLGAVWGSRKARNGYIEVSSMHPAIDGLFFPKDIAPQIGKMATGIDKFSEPLATSKFLKVYDMALRTWKAGVTIFAPSHHVRNGLGDSFLSWMDGLNNPIYYSKAWQVIKANSHRYSDLGGEDMRPFRELLGEGRERELIEQITKQSQGRIPKGTRVIATGKAGGKSYPISIDQVYQMGFRHGLFPHSSVVEDLPGTETAFDRLAEKFHPGKIGPFAPLKGKGAKVARGFSESREHYFRLAHYIYRLEHPPKKVTSLEELFESAAGQVRKFHPDGLDLTPTERRYFRRVIPFYSWNRKAIPLIIEGMLLKPHKFIMYPKGMSAAQEYQGIDSSVSDPWPDDQLFPNWLSSNVIGPTILPTSGFARAISRSPEEVGYGVINPGLPQTDIMEDFFNNPVKGIGNSVTPFAKIPAELGFDTEFMTGAPIEDYTQYADKNIPILANASRLSQGAIGTGLLEGGDLRGKETKPYNPAGIINFLTAAGILDTGRFIKGGEFDLKEQRAKERKKQREQYGSR